VEGEFKALERGWCLGGEEFRQELLEQVNARRGPSHFGEAVQEAAEAGAERVAVAALRRLGWTEEDLKRRRKGDPGKIKVAQELRSKTTMPLAWIAQRLRMGSRGYLAWLLQQQKGPKSNEPAKQKPLPL
jgi:CO/xanthine dehydrogenase Mo-binding subunit